jgi:hypothetical protein
MNQEKIEDLELLYRKVIKNPNYWKDDRPTSAVFKDSGGVSVDRDGNRHDSEVVVSFETRFANNMRAIVKIGAKLCRDLETEPKPDPNSENEFHALILPIEGIELTASKAKGLSRNCEVVKIYEDPL